MVEWGWIILYRCALMGRFYDFPCRAAKLMVSGGVIFLFYVFTSRVRRATTSGGPIFLCLKKDRGERQTKGLQSRPLDSGFLYGGSEGRRADFSTCAPGCN